MMLSIDGAESTDRSVEAASLCTNLNTLTVSFAESLTAVSMEHLLVQYYSMSRLSFRSVCNVIMCII